MLVWITYHLYKYPLVLPENPTIQNIKEEIRDEKYLKFAVDDQQLFCNSTLLENEKKVEDYGITSDSDIILRVIRRVQIEYKSLRFGVMIWDEEKVSKLKNRVASLIYIPVEKLVLRYDDRELQNDEDISIISVRHTVYAYVKFVVQILGFKRIYKVEVHTMMKVAALKQKLQTEYALDSTKIKLMSGDMPRTFLQDRAYLDIYDIKEETVIHAVGGGVE
ncbi:hypothetical protein JCGZ_21265 [Jatropha curcas]|uniref:Ubiquitin-like domain-containing protein n=1 Tax=Jatropha curcas TaxID=180498 RepID=A0A067JMR6_JATCU|nr:uncharacterized protein LOC110011039 [Jatropha curcas]KDP20794.1 hypothetical protein JCGZ_21265 [Jatropha curcas]